VFVRLSQDNNSAIMLLRTLFLRPSLTFYKTTIMWKTLKTIILSRLTKPKEDKEVLRKRKICKGCSYNSLNVEKIPLKKLIVIKVSDFYSWITDKGEDDILGNCTDCGCSVYYKSQEELENCPKGYWDKNKI